MGNPGGDCSGLFIERPINFDEYNKYAIMDVLILIILNVRYQFLVNQQNHLLRRKPADCSFLVDSVNSPHSAMGNVGQDGVGVVPEGAVHLATPALVEAALPGVVGGLVPVVVVNVAAVRALGLPHAAGVVGALAVEGEAVVHVANVQAGAGVVGAVDAGGGEVVVVLQGGVAVPVAGVEGVHLVDSGCG